LELYRLAQEARVAEFPDLALQMVKALVRFRSATWSTAESEPKIQIFSVHLHNEPEEMRRDFSAVNQNHTRLVLRAARQAGRAVVTNDTLAYNNRPEEAPMRVYLKQYGHQRNLLITDRSDWLSLYRTDNDDPFTARDTAVIDALLPHLVEAVAINRRLALVELAGTRQRTSRALIDRNGVFLYCGTPFFDLLRQHWHGWDEPRIPAPLLKSLERSPRARIAGGRVTVEAQPFGDALLLTAYKTSPLERLSPRERTIALEFGLGKSYKAIARELQLAPATVRNVLQKTYRKLSIDNKAALARLIDLEHS
jgi:DNA-binding CsgD family transcriptional regulator